MAPTYAGAESAGPELSTFVTDQFNLGAPNAPAEVRDDPIAGGESSVTITYHNAVYGDYIRIVCKDQAVRLQV